MSIDKEHITRDERRYNRATKGATTVKRPNTSSMPSVPDEETVSTKGTSSQLSLHDETKCFFCQCNSQGSLHDFQSANIEKQIKDTVHHFNNHEWKINNATVLSDNDALPRDIVYHNQCITEQ